MQCIVLSVNMYFMHPRVQHCHWIIKFIALSASQSNCSISIWGMIMIIMLFGNKCHRSMEKWIYGSSMTLRTQSEVPVNMCAMLPLQGQHSTGLQGSVCLGPLVPRGTWVIIDTSMHGGTQIGLVVHLTKEYRGYSIILLQYHNVCKVLRLWVQYRIQ